MFGHSDDRSRNNKQSDSGILTNDDNRGINALIGDMNSNYPPVNLQLPTTAPATPPAPVQTVPPIDDQGTGLSPATDTTTALPVASTHPDQLLDIKQQALQHLSPLVDHLEQSPSDRFRTTMMMIQASDNASLIKAAYDTALEIPDDKERAQALLDLINEINYFTQNQSGNQSKDV
jgi:hypothetical protein